MQVHGAMKLVAKDDLLIKHNNFKMLKIILNYDNFVQMYFSTRLKKYLIKWSEFFSINR